MPISYGYSWEYIEYSITSSGTIVNRVVASPSSDTFTLGITSNGTPGIAYGSSSETLTLSIASNPIPKSSETLTLDITSSGFVWGAQPEYVGHGAQASGNYSSVAVPYPSGLQLNDTLVLVMESPDGSTINAANVGFRTVLIANLPGQVLGNQTQLTVMMKAHWYTSESSVTVYGGEHFVARVFALRGARSKPNYIGPGGSGIASGANQTLTIPGTIAWVDECMILLAVVHGLDDATANVWNAQANPDLITIQERFEIATTAGNGGGLMLATAFIREAFPDPFADSTVVNALTNPTWAGAHLSIEPIIYPENDNFANAIQIVSPEIPGLLRYESGTYNATRETGETPTTLHNTCWWKFTPTQRQIARVWLVRREPQNYNNDDIRLLPLKGSAVNATTQYATVTSSPQTSFGVDGGRGLSAAYAYPHPSYGTPYPLRIQVTPDTPLYLQIGRQDYTFNADTLYRLDVSIDPPPENDDFDYAQVIAEGVNDSDAFVLDAATGLPGWIPDTSTYGFNPENLGDIWYKIQPTTDHQFGIRITRNGLSPSISNSHLIGQVFRGTSIGTLEHIRSFRGGYAGRESIHEGIDLVGGETYYIVVLFDGNWGDEDIFNLPIGGILDWRFFTPPDNDNFIDAEQLGNNDSGSTTVANLQGATNEGLPDSAYKDIWYEFTPVTGGWYEFTFGIILDGNADIWVAAYRGTSLATLKLANSNWVYYSGAKAATLALRGGETYKIRISRAYSTEVPDLESITWALLSAPQAASDDFVDRLVLTGASGNQAFTQEGGTSQEDEWPTYYWTDPSDATTWFEWTCPTTGCYFFEVDLGVDPADGYWSHELAVFNGNPLDGTDHKVCGNENGEPSSNTKVAFDATQGQTYYIKSEIYKSPYGTTWSPKAFELPYDFELNWGTHTKVTNHLFANAIQLNNEAGSFTSNTYGITTDLESGILVDGYTLEEISTKMYGYEETYGYLYPVGRVTWFKFNPVMSGRYFWEWSYANDYSNIWVNLFKGTDPGSLTRVKVPTGFSSSWGYEDPDDHENYVGYFISYGGDLFYADLVEGETYYIAIAGFTWDGPDTHDSGYPHWSRADIYQSQYDLTYGLLPPDNDTYGTVRNNQNNIGNLMRYTNYNSVTQPPQTVYTYTSHGSCGTGSTIGGSAETGEPAHAGITAERSVWYVIRPGTTGSYRVWIEGTGATPIPDSRMAIYLQTSAVNTLGAALASDVSSGPGDYPDFTVTLTAGSLYMIAVDGGLGEFTVKWQKQPVGTAPANDYFADAILLDDMEIANGTTVDATVECYELPAATALPYYYSTPVGPYGSVWYKWVASQTGVVFARVTGENASYYTFFDVYENGMVTNLINVAYTNYSRNNITASVPFVVTEGETYYIRVSDSVGTTFSLQIAVQSETPPGNDDHVNATTATGGGTTSGTTDGSTVQVGEPDPLNGGVLSNLAGTTWHKYVAPADGFIAAWVSRDTPMSEWHRIGIWEGNTASSGIIVPAYQDKPASPTASWAAYYEVRAGKTYWIQVVRDVTQSFGDYDLHIDEYLETNEWIFPDDGFDSTTGGITIDGGTIRCTGNQAISDVLSVTPQYGTVDLGSDTKKFYREFRISFQVRILGGQILYREMWSGGDDTSNVPLSSDDHVNYTTRSLGLFRCRDIAGNTVMSGYLQDPSREGTNQLVIRTYMTNPTGYAPEAYTSVSLGTGRPQHDTGWVSVELLLTAFNYQGYDSAAPGIQRLSGWVDSKPFTSYVQNAQPCLPIRYVDWGMFRHPSMVWTDDQRRAENNEAWTLEMRNMSVTNKVKLQPYDVTAVGDRGITHFDGFSAGTEWTADPPQSTLTKYSSQPGIETMPTKTWKSIHSKLSTTDERVVLLYKSQHGAGRVYALSLYLDQFPTTSAYPMVIARYGPGVPEYQQSGYYQYELPHGLASLSVDYTGELRVRPFGWLESCVAHLEVGKHYFIEVHTDFRFKADTECTVYINGESMGTYSSARSWSDVAAKTSSDPPIRWYSGNISQSWEPYQDLTFGVSQMITGYNTPANPPHEIHFTNTIAARDPGDMLGPKQVVAIGAATVDGLGHDIPSEDEVGDVFEMRDYDGSVLRELYGWSHEVTNPGPWNISPGSSYPFPTIERYWFPYFELAPTNPMLRTSNDFTMCGQSVPVDADIVGITVEAPSGGTAQLIKAGSPVGSSLGDTNGIYGGPTQMWGTTWTPQEVNALNFGVRITGVTITQLRQVRIKVYFEDEGEPLNISRGSQAPAGLFNVFGQAVASEFYFTGSGATVGCGGWWSGGDNGTGPSLGTMTATGTPQQHWQTIPGMWAWVAKGDKSPQLDVSGGSVTITDYRAIRDGLVVPRFGYSSDNGATWTWIRDPYETASAAYILDNAGTTPTGNTVFLDNNAHHEYFANFGGSWASGLLEDRPSSTYVYRYRYRHVRYGNDGTDETTIDSVNVYVRCRSYNGRPNTSTGTATSLWIMAESPDGNVKRVGVFPAGSNPSISRQIISRAPGCVPWTPTRISDLVLRLGSVPVGDTGAIARYSLERGAALMGLHYELLVPATADPAPTGCGGLVPMHWKVGEERPLSERVTRR